MLETAEPVQPADTARRAPAVSVIIPTYNRVQLLPATLDSIVAQTFSDYEIIVVDDGSTDGTREYVASRREPIVYLWQANRGPAAARNQALRVARGEFIAFLDSDDVWTTNFLEKMVARLRSQPDEGLVFSDFESMDPQGHRLRGHRKQPFGGDVTAPLFGSTFICTPAVVVRRSVIQEADGFNEQLSHNEDYDLWLRLSLHHRFGLVAEPLFRRRCHPESLSRNGCTPDVLLRKAHLLEQFYEQGGGKEKISEQLARRRLAKVYYTAGKAYCRAGKFAQASAALRCSLGYQHGRIKTWLWLLRARLHA